jgi:hypothetical protein
LQKTGTCPIILSVTVAAETKPKPISFGSHPKGNVPLHGEPNLMGFSIYGDRTFHDSREPAWAAGERTLVEVSPAYEPRYLSMRDSTRERRHG